MGRGGGKKRKREDEGEGHNEGEPPTKKRKVDGKGKSKKGNFSIPSQPTKSVENEPPQLREATKATPFIASRVSGAKGIVERTVSNPMVLDDDENEDTRSTLDNLDEIRTPLSNRISRLSKISLTESEISAYSVYDDEQSQLKTIMNYVIMICVWIVLFTAFLYISRTKVDPGMPNGLKYCDSEVPGTMLRIAHKKSECQACYKGGYCQEGKLIACMPGLSIEQAVCADLNDEYTVYALEQIDLLRKQLRVLKGKDECGVLSSKVDPGLYKSELKESMWNDFKEGKDLLPNEEDNLFAEFEGDYFPRFWKMLDDSQMNWELEIVTKFKEVEEGSEEDEDMEPEVIDEYIIGTKCEFGLYCRVKLLFKRFQFVLYGLVLLVIAGVGFHYYNEFQKERNQNISDLASMVLTRLKHRKGNKQVLVSDMKEEIMNIPLSDEVNIESLWDEVEEMVEGDSRVFVDADENEEKVWVWNSAITDDELLESPELRRRSIVSERASPEFHRRKLFRKSLTKKD